MSCWPAGMLLAKWIGVIFVAWPHRWNQHSVLNPFAFIKNATRVFAHPMCPVRPLIYGLVKRWRRRISGWLAAERMAWYNYNNGGLSATWCRYVRPFYKLSPTQGTVKHKRRAFVCQNDRIINFFIRSKRSIHPWCGWWLCWLVGVVIDTVQSVAMLWNTLEYFCKSKTHPAFLCPGFWELNVHLT